MQCSNLLCFSQVSCGLWLCSVQCFQCFLWVWDRPWIWCYMHQASAAVSEHKPHPLTHLQVAIFCTGEIQSFFVCWFGFCGESMRDQSRSGAVTIEHLVWAAEFGRWGGGRELDILWTRLSGRILYMLCVNTLLSVKLQGKLEKNIFPVWYLDFSSSCHFSTKTAAAATRSFAFF